MRLVAGVLSLALFAPFAHAEDTATPPAPASTPVPAPIAPGSSDGARARVPFRVVRVMPETRQALLFDRSRNTHVLVEVGGKLDGYIIEDIDDETVSLRRDNQQVVLAAPPHGAGRARELPPVRVRSALAAAPVSDAAPADPRAPGGAPAPGGPPAPIDPYEDPARPASGPAAQGPAGPAPGDGLPPEPGIRVAHAPGALAPLASAPVIVPGDGGVRVAVAPDVGPGVDPRSAVPSVAGPVAAPSALPAGPGAIRVVSAAPSAAPQAPSTSPGVPGAATQAPGTSPGVPGAVPSALGAPGAPSGPPAGPGPAFAPPTTQAVAPGPAPIPGAGAAASSAGGPGEPDRPGGESAPPVASPPRAPAAATAAVPPSDPRPAEIREVRAPDAARAPDKQTADARALADLLTADSPTRSPRALAEPPAPTHGAQVRPAVPPAPGDAIAISRSDLDSALADFARLTAGVRGSFSATGVVIDSVGDGTIFQRAGLRAGDVVTSVDGVRLRTLDDAANLYARASTARAITAQVVRAGKPVTLHVVIP
jgi:hypothetical protein